MKNKSNPALPKRKIKKNKNDNKKIYIITILVFIVSIVMFYVAIYMNSLMVLQEKVIYASLIIGNRGGFDVNTTALTMGMIRPGDSVSRSLFINNNYTIPVDVEFRVEGNISRFLKFEKKIHLGLGVNKTVEFVAAASADEPYGFYDGKVKAIFKRAE